MHTAVMLKQLTSDTVSSLAVNTEGGVVSSRVGSYKTCTYVKYTAS